MNAPSRPSNASSRARRPPQRPLPALPPVHETKYRPPRLSHLVTEDIREPFQLLETHPLNLICRFHNVKRVSLEEGVPPPLRFDVPVLRDAIEKADALLPTHVLAVYDHDNGSEETESSMSLSPHTADSSSGRPSLTATPLLIPVNADLWERCFAAGLSMERRSSPTPPSVPAADAVRQHSHTDSRTLRTSMSSRSSQDLNRNSPVRNRPHSVLSLPVYVVRVPSAKFLPLLLLSSLRILPHNAVLPALLPRDVLTELPAPPAILAQHLLLWLYPTPGGREKRSIDNIVGYSPFSGAIPITGNIPMAMPRRPRRPPSPLLSPSFTPDSDTMKRFSTTSASSFLSAGSSFSSFSTTSPRSEQAPEPVCVLVDPATQDDADLRLLSLTQQNFGLWANALALGVRDPAVVRLAELAWSVASEARRIRFDIGSRPIPND